MNSTRQKLLILVVSLAFVIPHRGLAITDAQLKKMMDMARATDEEYLDNKYTELKTSLSPYSQDYNKVLDFINSKFKEVEKPKYKELVPKADIDKYTTFLTAMKKKIETLKEENAIPGY